MLSNIWVYKKTSKVMISLLLAAVLVLATQNWLLGLLMFIVTAAALGKRSISFMDCRYGRGNASPGYYPGTESSQALGEGGVV